MKHAPKLIAAIAALILALGVAACGGDDDSNTSPSGTSSSSASGSNGGSPQSDDSQSERANGGADDKQGGSGEDEQEAEGPDDDGGETTNTSDAKGEDRKRTAQSEEKEAREFKPKTYDDSGGGSKQFRNPEGYDNSIQDYGSETTGSELEEASANLHNFYDARAEGNWAATCLYMSAGQVKSLQTLYERSGKDVSCAEAVEGLTGSALDAPLKEEAAAIDVGSMRVEGDRAFLIYRGLEKGIYAMPMARENGQWLVAGYAGSRIN